MYFLGDLVNMSLGIRLKKEREKRNWSQLFVAEKIGITNAVLSNYERGVRDPDTTTLKKISNLYEVSIDYLITGENNIFISNTNILLNEVEFEIIEELKKYPIFYHDLAKDPEKKIKELLKLQKARDMFIKEVEKEEAIGTREIE